MARPDRARPTHPRPADRAVLALTSALGLGYAPVAPGTFGTLAALPLWYAWTRAVPAAGLGATLAALLALTALACALSARAETLYGAHDVQRIVIDEVVGLLWAVVAVPWTPATVVWAFLGFRLLDATKPGPIGWVDARVPGGVGVVLDDVAAGACTCAGLHAAHAAGLLAF